MIKVEMIELDDKKPYQDTINKFLIKLDEQGHIYKDIKFLTHINTSYAVVIYQEADPVIIE